MIYYVTNSIELFDNDKYTIIGADYALSLLQNYNKFQADSETSGKDPHICDLLLFQLGTIDKEIQFVIDCTTVDIRLLGAKYNGEV